jgi:hypothetical protein
MTRTGAAVLIVLTVGILPAKTWDRSLAAHLTTDQDAYSSNWPGAETGILNWTLGSDFSAERTFVSGVRNRNTATLALGYALTQDTAHKWGKPAKSDDQIDLLSNWSYAAWGQFGPSGSAHFESQFVDGRDSALTRYVNPMELTEGAGIGGLFYKRSRTELNLMVGLAGRQKLDRNTPGRTPSSARRTVFDDYGGLLTNLDFSADSLLGGLVSYTSNFSLFKAYLYSGASKLPDSTRNLWKPPTFEWQNEFQAAIAKLLTVDLNFELQYDRQVSPGLQFKETLSLGLQYRLL